MGDGVNGEGPGGWGARGLHMSDRHARRVALVVAAAFTLIKFPHPFVLQTPHRDGPQPPANQHQSLHAQSHWPDSPLQLESSREGLFKIATNPPPTTPNSSGIRCRFQPPPENPLPVEIAGRLDV